MKASGFGGESELQMPLRNVFEMQSHKSLISLIICEDVNKACAGHKMQTKAETTDTTTKGAANGAS